MEEYKIEPTHDVAPLFGASIQPELFPPETLRICTTTRNKDIKPPRSMLAPIPVPDVSELINEFIKISDEFKIEFDDSEVSNGS